MKSLSCVRLFEIPWIVACQTPLSMGFSRQEYWSGLSLPSPGDLPNPGIEPGSPALQAGSLVSQPLGFDCVDHNKLWKILKEMGIPDHQTSLLRNLYAGHKPTELDMKQQTGSKLGKEYIKAVYCHPAYLTYMQSTSWETLGWRKHKLESRLPGEISITSDMQMILPLLQKVKKN